jgi:hypothetical protein
MCHGNSIISTCPHCTTVDQTFEFHDCHFGHTPTSTWWILPSAILEDVYVTEACDECFFLFNWLEELPSPTSLTAPDDKEDFSIFENPIWHDDDRISISATEMSEDESADESGDHLELVCSWYEDIETYLSSIKSWFPTMRSRCVATRNPALITQLGILEATVELTPTQSLEKVEYVIEVSTWIRYSTSDESKLRNTDPEELRIAMWEMRKICVELGSEEGCADAVTEKLGVMASEVWERLEVVEQEMERYAELYVDEEVEERMEKKTLVGRVLSMIV